MSISIFDIYKIGIGPSSSHTFGPMVASNMFIETLENKKLIEQVESISVNLYGSLALTGKGHATFLAIELGLEGFTPETIKPDSIDTEIKRIEDDKILKLSGKKIISYERSKNFNVHKTEELEYHSNGMSIEAFDKSGKSLYFQTYYSVGGGFIVTQDEVDSPCEKETKKPKYEFCNFKKLLEIAKNENKSIYDIVLENEKVWRSEEEIDKSIRKVVDTMNETIENGLNRKGDLRGGLKLGRRAPALLKKLQEDKSNDPLNVFEWVSLWGLAGAEENASLGKIVTAPTNGAAALIPAVLKFFEVYHKKDYTFENIKKFIIVSGIVGILCKKNATISGAEGGCQAEIGSACSMASAGLTSALGGTDLQIENSAVMALVQNLGLTCDPVAGLVQVPCIERNPINAVKAINTSRIALREEKSLFVTLDQAILTMKQIGKDMQSKYKETSQGGLAINSKDGRETPCINCLNKTYCSGN